MSETVEVIFNDDQTITVHVKGTKGHTCKNINEVIAKALGGTITKRTATAEMNQTVKQETRKQVTG